MFVYICKCAARTVIVPSGLSDVLLRDQSFSASKIMRELKHSVITKVHFARDSFQKHYPHTRGNAADSPSDVFHAFYHPCRVSKKGKQDSRLAQALPEQQCCVPEAQLHSSLLTPS